MGVVYRVRHAETGGEYALKTLLPGGGAGGASPEEVARFGREAEALARVQHPNVVALHSVGQHGGALYQVMELVSGEDLLSRSRREHPMDPDEVARILADVARAVHVAHRAGILHRDLKPSNVLLAADGAAKVADFGLAFLADAERLTRTGTLVGTPSYMAPEQLDVGEGATLGPRCDVYGLGATLYRVLTDQAPFPGSDPVNVIAHILTAHAAPPSSIEPGVPPELEAICLKALEKEPDRRYPSAEALADDLDRWRRGEPTHARPLGRLARLGRRLLPPRGKARARRIAAFALATAAAGALVGVAIVSAVRTGSGRETVAEARTLRDFDEAYGRAVGGEHGAIADALAVTAELERDELAGDEAARLESRTADLRAIEASIDGDRVAFERVLRSDLARERRDGLVALFLSEGATDGLVRWIERDETLLQDAAVLDRIARTIDLAVVEPSDRSFHALVADALLVRSRVVPAEERRAAVTMRRAVLIARLRAIVGEPEVDRADLLDALRDLLPLIRARAIEAEVAALDWSVLVALAHAEWDRVSREGDEPADLATMVETVALLLPPDDPRVLELVGPLGAAAIALDLDKERAYTCASLLDRLGAPVFKTSSLGPLLGRDAAAIETDVRELLRRDPLEADPWEIHVLLVHLQDVRERAILEGAGVTLDTKWFARVKALGEHWPLIDAVLLRDRREGDVPDAFFAWLAGRLWNSIGRSGGEGTPHPDWVALRDRVATSFAGEVKVSEEARIFEAAVDLLFDRAVERSDQLPPERQRLDLLAGALAWRAGRPMTREGIADRVRAVRDLARQAGVIYRDRVGKGVGWGRAGDVIDGVAENLAKLGESIARLDREAGDPADCPSREPVEALAAMIREIRPESGRDRVVRAWHLARHDDLAAALELFDEAVAHEERGSLREGRVFKVLMDEVELLIEHERDAEAHATLLKTLRFDAGGSELRDRARLFRELGDEERAAEDERRERARKGGG